LPVKSPEDVPRLYRGHPLDLDTARLVLKIPRPMSRRDANSDMDLYDNLLVAGPAALTVLSRRGDAYQSVEVPYRRIAAVQTSVALLDGLLVVHDVEGPAPAGVAVSVRYNGVSHDLVTGLVRILRSAALAATRSAGVPAARPSAGKALGLKDLGDADVALVTAVHELAEAEPSFVTLASHRRTTVRRADGSLRGLLDAVRPVTLHAAVVCADPGELQVLHRRHWFSTGQKPVHSVARTVVLMPMVTGADPRPVARYTAVECVRITSGRAVVEVPFPEGAETGSAIRRALGGARAG
jgi:hypothetical protein